MWRAAVICRGTCHVHIPSLMPLLCLGFICLLYKALSVNDVSEGESCVIKITFS